jgi:hypothetical protein
MLGGRLSVINSIDEKKPTVAAAGDFISHERKDIIAWTSKE